MKILSGIYYIYYRTPGNNRCQWKGTFFLDLAAALAAWSVLASPKFSKKYCLSQGLSRLGGSGL